jgi:hypothetical protein
MAIKLPVPRYTYDQLRGFAAEFLRKHNPEDQIPVPIEEIAESGLGLDIIPIPGLQRAIEIDGFVSSDLSAITVDQFVLENRLARYRFTLAHEIAHLYLHRGIFEQLRFSTIAEWKNFQLQVDAGDYSWLEWQAYSFAGLALVPPEHLRREFEICAKRAEEDGLTPGSEAALWYIVEVLTGLFQVSRGVLEKRIAKDKLWKQEGP